MVFSKIETVEIEELKQKNKLEIAKISHTNTMKELTLQLEIAKYNAVISS